jgi:hypothetical protein
LSFFEVWPPPILGRTEEEAPKEIGAIDHIDVNCVARLDVALPWNVVGPEKALEFHPVSWTLKRQK